MEQVKLILNACTEIMRYRINLCGYNISLMNVLVFGILAYLALRLFHFFD